MREPIGTDFLPHPRVPPDRGPSTSGAVAFGRSNSFQNLTEAVGDGLRRSRRVEEAGFNDVPSRVKEFDCPSAGHAELHDQVIKQFFPRMICRI